MAAFPPAARSQSFNALIGASIKRTSPVPYNRSASLNSLLNSRSSPVQAKSTVWNWESSQNSPRSREETPRSRASNFLPASNLNAVHHHIFERLHIVAIDKSKLKPRSRYTYLTMDTFLLNGECADSLGPASIDKVHRFCTALDDYLRKFSEHKYIAIVAPPNSEILTNAVVLVGAYMLLWRNIELESIVRCFSTLLVKVTPFQQVYMETSDVKLEIIDCWEALLKARELGWIDPSSDRTRLNSIDLVPGKFVAFWSSQDKLFSKAGAYSSATSAVSALWHERNVWALLRFAESPVSHIVETGVAKVCLPIADGAAPAADAIAKFMTITDVVPGAIAVDCSGSAGGAGQLSPAGPLVALFMVRDLGFTARQAVAWLRIVSPGVLSRAQPHFVLDKEPVMRRCRAGVEPDAAAAPAAEFARRPGRAGLTRHEVAAVEEAVAAAVRRVDNRVKEFKLTRALKPPAPTARPQSGCSSTDLATVREEAAGAAVPEAAAVVAGGVVAGGGVGNRVGPLLLPAMRSQWRGDGALASRPLPLALDGPLLHSRVLPRWIAAH